MTAYEPIGATRTYSETQVAWLPPAHPTTRDIDWIAVERAAYGDKPQHDLQPAELRATVVLMARLGRTERQIADYLDINVRQVARWKYANPNAIGNSRRRGACTVKACTRMCKARGLCNAHYQQVRRREATARRELQQAA